MPYVTKAIAIIACSIIPIFSIAQNPFYVHYTTEDGLPSIECYDLIQDKAGFIWIGTDRGLCRFDGSTFKTFTSNDGLPGNIVTTLFPDPDGHIWANCHDRGMVYTDGTTLVVPEQYATLPLEKSSIDDFISFGPEKQIITYSSFLHMSHVASIISNQKPSEQILKTQTSKHEMVVIESAGTAAFGFSSQPSSNQILIREDSFSYEITLDHHRSAIHDAVLSRDRSRLYIALENELLCIDNRTLKASIELPSSISNNLFVDEQNNLWVGTSESGAFMFEAGVLTAEPKRYLKNYHVTSILEDAQNGIWFSTIQDGIFHMPIVELNVMNMATGLPENRITYAFHVDDILWMIYRDGAITQTNLHTRETHLMADYRYIFDAFIDENGRLNVAVDHPIEERIEGVEYWGPSSYIYYQPDTIVVANVRSSVSIIPKQGIPEEFIPANRIPRSYDIEEFLNAYYFATQSGLYSYDKSSDSIKSQGESIPEFRENVSSLVRWNHLLIAGMGGTGLIILEENGNITHLTSDISLSSNYITNLKIDDADRLWICTPTGLNMLDLNGAIKGDYSVFRIGKEEGLPVPSVNDVVIIDNTLWAMTDGGVAIIPLESVQGTITPPLYITDFEVNGQPFNWQSELSLGPNQNNIQVGFQSIAYKNQSQLKYYYKLLSNNEPSDWTVVSTSQLNFANLSPGDYQLEIKSGFGEVPLDSRILMNFSIAKPLIQRWYVLITLFFLLFWVGFLYYRSRLQQFKRQVALEQQVSTLGYRALRAQMNPHFIYNALNAIQNFIIQQDEKASIAYLSSFSKLIRFIFENSSRDHVALEEELETISLYLELESARYPDRFTIESFVDPSLKKARIAPMIIQPFIENAILHGLLPSSKDGKISLKITNEGKHIHVIIEDNGIGILKGRKIGEKKRAYLHANASRERQSGVSVTKERITEMGNRYRIQTNFSTLDLSTTNTSVTGTRVSFNLPFIRHGSD